MTTWKPDVVEREGLRSAADSRAYLTEEVGTRAFHDTAEQVRTTCSFARAERLFGREYHGRFLIELLQNAADAWEADERSEGGRSRVAVMITEGPALLLANQGAPMSARVVIESLGHIGASTKAEGEAIGHKGIGFKSVLEMTSTPEIYSGLGDGAPQLAVRFDPAAALRAIRDRSPEWDRLLSEVGMPEPGSDLSAVPVLRYPQWVDVLPPEVMEMAAEGFDTVVRLPYAGSAEGVSDWLRTVRIGLADISDQILVLLGSFSEVRITDRIAGDSTLVVPTWEPRGEGSQHQAVTVLRNDVPSSRWILYRRTLADETEMAAEIAVGVRLEPSTSEVVPANHPGPSAPFHLFFPTRIPSGLPFLLHGYFSVDASRTAFYRGSAEQNEAILGGLARLVCDAVTDAVSGGHVDPITLVNLIAECNPPEDPQALAFRDAVMGLLDEQAWIPACDVPDQASLVSARETLVAEGPLSRHVSQCFPADYVLHRVGLRLPAPALSDKALLMIASRQPSDHPTVWTIVHRLLRPGQTDLWKPHEADRRFLALLDLLDALRIVDSRQANTLVTELQGNPAARLLPVAVGAHDRELTAVPDPSSALAGARSQLVMARVRLVRPELPVPPKELGVHFLADGLLGSETDVDRAKRLGVRPFTVDNVLDRLNGIGATDVDPGTLLTFAWKLLSRERVSSFSTRRCAERAVSFDPDAWFWCTPGRTIDESGRDRQQRERYLAQIPLPARDGSWRPAGELAFGADWADWIADRLSGPGERVDAYRALEAISPGPHALLAAPAVIMPLLAGQALEREPDSEATTLNAQRHAFLLRLGVWEVVPLEAFENRQTAGRDPFPWEGDIEEARQEAVSRTGGWAFGLDGWGGKRHRSVYVSEDYRFAWDIADAAERDVLALARSLQYGITLYQRRRVAYVFCARCRDSGSSHTVPRASRAEDGYPSWMAIQLRDSNWVKATVDGLAAGSPTKPAEVWWRSKIPTGAALRQSPWRIVPVCGPETGISHELKNLAGISSIEDASMEDILRLLTWLTTQFKNGALPADPRSSASARQAFISIHRQAYERLADLLNGQQEDARRDAAVPDVLCELGDDLAYLPVGHARHDDGRYSSYVRHFVGRVALFVLPRDQEARAATLGIAPFIVDLDRRGTDEGADVTGDLHALLYDRVAEILAIVVHHSLGTMTLEIDSGQFATRANRLQALTVRYVPDLVIDAQVRGTDMRLTIGQGSGQDLFLEGASSSTPVLYHDLSGPDWQDRIRRKIGPYLAALLENGAYAHTFALFLQQDSDAEREEFLLELGISSADVDEIAARIGAVGQEHRESRRCWVKALSRVLAQETPPMEADEGQVTKWLSARGVSAETAGVVEKALGTESARSDVSEGGLLQILQSAGVDLHALDRELRLLGDPGLRVKVAHGRFVRWMETNGRRVVLLLSLDGQIAAERAVRELSLPQELAFSLNPALEDLLAPVAALLAAHGYDVAPEELARRPGAALAAAGGYDSPTDLDVQASLLCNDEERTRVLRERAGQWRRELRLLGVLARMGPSETRATVRKIDADAGRVLPLTPSSPSQLCGAVGDLFPSHPNLGNWLISMLNDSVLSPPPDREELLGKAADEGIVVGRLPVLQRALDAPRREHARAIQRRSQKLVTQGVLISVPQGLAALKTTALAREQGGEPGRKRVAAVKVGEGHDRRKRELGDEGEEWALAVVAGHIVGLDADQRNVALDAIQEMLTYFEGPPVDSALAYVDMARSSTADEEELIDDLTGLLHVSRHSDAFGFDLIGWLPVHREAEPIAMCIEVKNAGGEEFHLSLSEWKLAERLHREGMGDHYAVLVVHRGKRGGPPTRLDLLPDPVRLEREGKVRRYADGYAIRYGFTDGAEQ